MIPTPENLRAERALRWLVGAAAAIVVVGGIHVAAPLVTRLLVMAFLSIILTPCYHFLRRLRLPGWLAVTILVVALTGGCVWGLGFVVPRALMDFSRKVPAYFGQLSEAVNDLLSWLHEHEIPVPREVFDDLLSNDPVRLKNLLVGSISRGGGLLSDLVIVLIVVCFYFAELPHLPERLDRLPWLTPARRALLDGFVRDVRHYMGIKTVVSAATALVIYAGLRLLGVDSPVLLALLAFLLNFVPAVGSVLAAIPGVLLALSSGGVPTAIWTTVVYLATNQILGNIVEPRVMGAGFGVSPVVVMLSVVFWGWVLGPVGMLLAVPLTMAVRGTLAVRKGAVPPAAAPSA